MEKRMVTVYERAMTTTVNDIEHMESSPIRAFPSSAIYFQPNVEVELALAQITAISQTIFARCRPAPSRPTSSEVRRIERPHSAARLCKVTP